MADNYELLNSRLRTAARQLDLERVELLLEKGANVDTFDPSGPAHCWETPLLLACKAAAESPDDVEAADEVAAALLDAGAGADGTDEFIRRPLDFALYAGMDRDIVGRLIKLVETMPLGERRSYIDNGYGDGCPWDDDWAPLTEALDLGWNDEALKMLEWGADPMTVTRIVCKLISRCALTCCDVLFGTTACRLGLTKFLRTGCAARCLRRCWSEARQPAMRRRR